MLNAFLDQAPAHLLYPGPPFTQENTLVNYLWVDPQPWKATGPGDALCGARLSYFDKAYENARRYPETDFILWVDFSRMDDMARFWVQSHYAHSAPANMRLQNLWDLPDYRQASIQLPRQDLSKTRRPDLARLYVMRACLRTAPDKTYIMYCDLDTEDARIGCPHSQRILSRHGMLHTYVTSLNKPQHGAFLGLGYLVFRRDIADGFLAELIPLAEKQVVALGFTGIEKALNHTLQKWVAAQPGCHIKDLIHPETLLHPVGYIMPEDPFYAECGINY